jgi:hypothetical protein
VAEGPKFQAGLPKSRPARSVRERVHDRGRELDAGQKERVTDSRDTLKDVKTQHRNVTLSLPEPLLRRFRVYAASRNESMTSVMADAIRRLMTDDAGRSRAKRCFLDRIRNAPDRGTKGRIRWTRDELHEH